ncbi:hypothetical protein GCM10009678_92270 [Actinomadura kijaniata]|uniref:Uncharacterized protein n=1 Tax=Actinomadura namibiensis TaxID=182080 RepID=A0A7W3LZX1_ACTNM|nr:hypothetical protein [Actinomadura namibiensis]
MASRAAIWRTDRWEVSVPGRAMGKAMLRLRSHLRESVKS